MPTPEPPAPRLPATVIAAHVVRERLAELIQVATDEGADATVLGPLRDAWDLVDGVVEGLLGPWPVELEVDVDLSGAEPIRGGGPVAEG